METFWTILDWVAKAFGVLVAVAIVGGLFFVLAMRWYWISIQAPYEKKMLEKYGPWGPPKETEDEESTSDKRD